MARFARIDSQIRANHLILANRMRVPKLNPFLCESRFGAQQLANRRFEVTRANHSNIMKIGDFLRIDSCESIRANHLDSSGKSKWGLSNGGLRPLPAICAQLSTIVHFFQTFGPLSEGAFVAKRRQKPVYGGSGPRNSLTFSQSHKEKNHLK